MYLSFFPSKLCRRCSFLRFGAHLAVLHLSRGRTKDQRYLLWFYTNFGSVSPLLKRLFLPPSFFFFCRSFFSLRSFSGFLWRRLSCLNYSREHKHTDRNDRKRMTIQDSLILSPICVRIIRRMLCPEPGYFSGGIHKDSQDPLPRIHVFCAESTRR